MFARPILAAAVLAAFAFAAPAAAQQLKVGTVAPEGSPWHDMLLDLNARWKTVSGGKISLRIYPSGTQGDEPDMIRKMRIGQLHAAALTSVGMEAIATEMNALSIPFLFESWEEVDYVRDRLGPRLKKSLEDKGSKDPKTIKLRKKLGEEFMAVSYTHLTLPTICSV